MAKKCKCNIISFGPINLYILLIPLATIFSTAIEAIISQSDKLSCDSSNKQKHPIVLTINYALGLCLSFIFFIIYKTYNKKNKATKLFLLERMMNKSTHNNKITNKEKFLWILLGSCLDFAANVIYNSNPIDSTEFLVFWPTNILLMALFAYLLLKTKLYRHHYLSIFVIIGIGLAYNFISGKFNIDKLKMNKIGHICYFSTESTFNVLYVLYKYFMLIKFINLYAMLFFQGLIELILGIIALTITTTIKKLQTFDSFSTYKEGLDIKEIFIFIGLIFVHFLSYLTIYIIIDIFTPFHIFLVDILSQLILFFIDEDLGSKITIAIACSIFLFLCVFMSLIFIEIIQLNFCGLSTMTKKNIEIRAALDTIINDDNDDEEDNKEGNDKVKEDKRISLKEYSIELKNLSINRASSVLPSDIYSVESGVSYNVI